MSNNIIICENLVKIYKTSEIEVMALQGLDLTVQEGELMAIIGNSGSGKSTLLNMIGGLDRATAGRLIVDQNDLFRLNEKQLMQYKLKTVGFVWQNSARNSIQYLTALENVEIMCPGSQNKKRERAKELLSTVGLSDRGNSKSYQMSGGEQQRLAIAIALANNPRLLLADEPTGSVDTKTAAYILDVFKELNKDFGLTIIIVTHDRQLSKKVGRVVAIRDGRTSSEFIKKNFYRDQMKNIHLEAEEQEEEAQEEFAVVDKAGRLQIPSEYIEALGLTGKNKIKVELENDHIVLTPPKL